jgi:pantetheine-phosphate adenylyltransferase
LADDKLLGRKSNRHVMETMEQRMEGVREFLELFRPQIEHDVVVLSDVYGPTAVDPDIQALVVSKETIAGGESSTWTKEPQ